MSRVLGSKLPLIVPFLVVVGILAIMGCKPDSVGPDRESDEDLIPMNCSDEIVLPDGADYGEFFPEHASGDCDFGPDWKTHGPKVNVDARLSVDESKTQLWLLCSMVAVETEADLTEAKGSWKELIYTAPQGWYINKISSAVLARGEYTDANVLWDRIETSMCTFDIMGNTLLNDVCNTIIDGDATRIKIHLNPISVVLCDQRR